ncbi:MAG: class II histone deacetylase [Chloroflexota bacterium]|nr:class II histone deacetylase [Chloroflexota bacterium]|tara:strand:- start:5200 stop:6270 length:1071 start_codon:yes stop_codon:yes gene_type:complete
MSTGFLWHEKYMWHDTGSGATPDVEPDEHFENADTKRRMKNLLDLSGLTDQLVRLDPRMATEDELRRFHTDDYINSIRELSDHLGGMAGPGTPFGKGSYEIAKLAAGGTIVATEAVLSGQVNNSYALVRPPGHHAERDLGRGFCIFGNVALAAMHARDIWQIERIATIDWDVHHGNGTQQAFYDDPNVLTISIHQDGLFPKDSGTVEERGANNGQNYNINIPLPAGSGHGAYSAAIERVVVPAVQSFRPQLILVPCGFDASVYDPLGRMLLTSESYRELTKMLLALANATCDGKIVFSHEGGYSKRYVPFCGLATIEALSGIRTEITDQAGRDDLPGQELAPHQEAIINEIAQSLP